MKVWVINAYNFEGDDDLLAENANILKDHNLIYFAPEPWHGLWRNRQQLMSVFARQNKVLFVEPPSHLRATLKSLRQGELNLRATYQEAIRQVSDNLFLFQYPVWAPVSGQLPLGWLTRLLRQISLQNVLRQLKMSKPIVWLSRPSMIRCFDEVKDASLFIYHVVDEYSAYVGHTAQKSQATRRREQNMLTKVDAVVVVSNNLYESKKAHHPHTYLVPNGVNYDAYSAALANSYLPEQLQSIRAPRLGYIGLIGDKLDLTMLYELAKANSDWSLVLLGDTNVIQQAETWQALQALPNVYHLEAVDVSEVPHYVKGFDVGLMPYLQNRHADNISPLKLYDYLAAGLPVASMDIPAARSFGQTVHLADTPAAFEAVVRAALADRSTQQREARRSVAARHTWEKRVEQLSEIIEAGLAAKGSANTVSLSAIKG